MLYRQDSLMFVLHRTYSMNNSVFDVALVVYFGFLALLIAEYSNGQPRPAALLAICLGRMMREPISAGPCCLSRGEFCNLHTKARYRPLPIRPYRRQCCCGASGHSRKHRRRKRALQNVD